MLAALGIGMDLVEGHGETNDAAVPGRPGTVRVHDYPQLRRIAWQLAGDTELDEREALDLYERNWRHVDLAAMDAREHEFVQYLADTWSHGRLLV